MARSTTRRQRGELSRAAFLRNLAGTTDRDRPPWTADVSGRLAALRPLVDVIDETTETALLGLAAATQEPGDRHDVELDRMVLGLGRPLASALAGRLADDGALASTFRPPTGSATTPPERAAHDEHRLEEVTSHRPGWTWGRCTSCGAGEARLGPSAAAIRVEPDDTVVMTPSRPGAIATTDAGTVVVRPFVAAPLRWPGADGPRPDIVVAVFGLDVAAHEVRRCRPNPDEGDR